MFHSNYFNMPALCCQDNEQEIESEDENGLEKDFECTAIESEIKAGTNKPQLS